MTVVSIPRRWLALLVLTLPPACADPEPVPPDRTESIRSTVSEWEAGVGEGCGVGGDGVSDGDVLHPEIGTAGGF